MRELANYLITALLAVLVGIVVYYVAFWLLSLVGFPETRVVSGILAFIVAVVVLFGSPKVLK